MLTVPGGLTIREGMYIAEELAATSEYIVTISVITVLYPFHKIRKRSNRIVRLTCRFLMACTLCDLADKLTGIDLVEVNPELGSKQEQELTLFTACEVIGACFGKRRKGNVPQDYKIPVPEENMMGS